MKNKITPFLFGIVLASIIYFIIQYMAFNSENPSFPPPPTDATRFEVARYEKLDWARGLLHKNNISEHEFDIFFRAFKEEQIFEVWAKSRTNTNFVKLIDYPFCRSSGTLGPKRKEGDRQIPEGFYHINVFNPKSNFYLSLGINYPNKADLKHADPQQPGSDIYIHGGCQTVGCIPLTNDKIKEVYLLAKLAKQSGQTHIPVHIFPARLTNKKLEKLSKNNPQYAAFWQDLQAVYLSFENRKELLTVKINTEGRYYM